MFTHGLALLAGLLLDAMAETISADPNGVAIADMFMVNLGLNGEPYGSLCWGGELAWTAKLEPDRWTPHTISGVAW